MDFAAIHTTATAKVTENIGADVGRILIALEEMMEGTLPAAIKIRIATQVAEYLESAGASLLTPEGITDLVAGRPIASLGAGTPTPGSDPDVEALVAAIEDLASSLGVASGAELVSNMATMFGPMLTDANPVQNAKLGAMIGIADNSVPVNADGTIDHSAAVNPVQAELDSVRDPHVVGSLANELAAVNRSVTTLTTERDNARGQLAPLQGTVDQAVADLAALKAAVDGNSRLKRELAKPNGLSTGLRSFLGL